jgi:hypothetical protein
MRHPASPRLIFSNESPFLLVPPRSGASASTRKTRRRHRPQKGVPCLGKMQVPILKPSTPIPTDDPVRVLTVAFLDGSVSGPAA